MGAEASHATIVASYRSYTCQSRNRARNLLDDCRYVLNADEIENLVISKIEREYLSEKSIEHIRKVTAKYISEQRGQQRCREASAETSLKQIEKKLQDAEDRIISTPADMLDALYKQIRTLREQRDKLQIEVGSGKRLAQIAEVAIGKDAQNLVASLRKLRDRIKYVESADVRKAIGEIVESIEVFTIPAVNKTRETGYAAKRRFSHVKINFKADYVLSVTDGLSSVT